MNTPDELANTSCGFIALVGAPNAGKSTLLHIAGHRSRCPFPQADALLIPRGARSSASRRIWRAASYIPTAAYFPRGGGRASPLSRRGMHIARAATAIPSRNASRVAAYLRPRPVAYSVSASCFAVRPAGL